MPIESTDTLTDETDQDRLKAIQAKAKALSTPLLDLSKLRMGDASIVVALEKLAGRFPDESVQAAALAELRNELKTFAKQLRERRSSSFGRVLAEFITARRSGGVDPREMSSTVWRIGAVEIDGDAAGSRARAKYANEVVVEWRPVAAPSDLEKLVSDAMAALKKVEISQEQLGPVFGEAYDLLSKGGLADRQQTGRVRLIDLRREVHLAILRRALSKGPKSAVLKQDFPAWAFAYNADRYRGAHRDLPTGQRLSFVTGSQQDHKSGLALTMNALDPKSDHKSFCYVEQTPGEATS